MSAGTVVSVATANPVDAEISLHAATYKRRALPMTVAMQTI
ncbi:MAG TPA: hypothetical protein VE622_00430 [Nitrososphaeraceae archaeon]|nr:hypothetical protein [Nitrososphaeraceae archaeon]